MWQGSLSSERASKFMKKGVYAWRVSFLFNVPPHPHPSTAPPVFKEKKKKKYQFFFQRVQITNNNDDDDDDDDNNNKPLIQSLILNPALPPPTTSTLMTSGKFRFTLYYVISIASSGRLLGHKQSIIKLFERPHFNQHSVTGFVRSELC